MLAILGLLLPVSAGPVATASPEGARVPAAQSVRVAHQTRVQRVRDARNVLEGFRVREAQRQQEVKRLQDSEEERCAITIIQRDFFQGLEVQRVQEAIGRREAQRVYDEKLAENEQRVHDRKRVHEAAHARFTAAIDAFSRQHKRARTPESVVGEVVEEQVIGEVVEVQVVGEMVEVQVVGEMVEVQVVGEVVEAEAVVPVVDAAEAVVVSVVEAPEAVLVVVDVTEAELKRADLAAAEAIAYVYKVRRDIFLQEREARNSQLALNHRQLALNHEGRVRAECERVERGVIVAPVEYVLLEVNREQEAARYWRVLLGECNLTFSYLDYSGYGERRGLTRKEWEDRYKKTAPLWKFWNPIKGPDMPEIDPDFQDDVFILPHFREEIGTHLESQSMIHTAIQSIFALGPSAHAPYKLDTSFEVTLKFLARMKKFNRLEFATISCAL